ncbi:crossover junction endodeoxyribonuclease RuvC [Neisseriaceae bacterium TC5R-5]|nr:crossover junction endodeoxyribonuclease RuvC [Neisseriaceae bacterium TC5R-5]
MTAKALLPAVRRVLGIDPGSRITGFGVIDLIGQQRHYIASGCIRTPPNAVLAERIRVIIHGLFDVIDTYQIHEAAVEQVFVNVNPAATLMLGQARGACLSALVLRDLPVAEYTALQVKKSVVGHGKAAKEQVQHMVVRMLNLSGTPQADAADALAVALAHANLSTGVIGALARSGLKIRGGRLV